MPKDGELRTDHDGFGGWIQMVYYNGSWFVTSGGVTSNPNSFRGANVSNKCTIWYDPKLDGYTLQCAFSPDFIDFIKQAIPASDRSFDPPSKNWKFHKKYADAVLKTAKKIFGDNNVAFISEAQVRGATPAAGKNLSIDQTIVEFMKLLPFDAANAAFRKAAMLLHPDRGGNMESMSKLNTLWDRIRTELYKEP